jgi:hypothetical protein
VRLSAKQRRVIADWRADARGYDDADLRRRYGFVCMQREEDPRREQGVRLLEGVLRDECVRRGLSVEEEGMALLDGARVRAAREAAAR